MKNLKLVPTCVRCLIVAAAITIFHSMPAAAQVMRRSQIGLRNPRTYRGITLKTSYMSVHINTLGQITSLQAASSRKEYSPADRPSPLLCLEEGHETLVPISATFEKANRALQIVLNYAHGVKAKLTASQHNNYLRFQLNSITPRDGVNSVVWGPVHTTITGKIGDLIGVVRSDDWAIGMMGLTDNTIGGPPAESDFFQMGYYIHSLDPVNHPVPAPYHEGQRLGVGGDGKNDVAFFSHPEEYFQFIVGSAAKVDPGSGSSVTYHSRDRRKPYTFLYSLLPDFPDSTPRHQITDPVDADYIGSAIALYACPDNRGLSVIESIIVAEGLPHITRDGIWIRDPRAQKPDMAWYGPHDRLIEYADALGLKAVQDESLGEYYPNPKDIWGGKKVGFRGGRTSTIKEFADLANAHGILYGLHTLCTFVQPNSSDVSPVPNHNLQTVLRTRITNGISPTDTALTVADASYLAEPGTWHGGPDGSVLRIGDELLTYKSITTSSPSTLTGVKRGQYGTVSGPHAAGDEVAKLQMNCYHGFVPDMELLLKYADYYANLLYKGGMQYVDFDGLESTLYQNQGYYAVRVFFRRLFEKYQKLSGGKYLRVMASATFPGGWEYESVGNVGGGRQNFDPVANLWGIEGKDIRNGYGNSYYPGTFGIQNYNSDWCTYDAENLQAKSIGWDATYMLGLSESSVEKSGEKAAIFKQYRMWEDARAAYVFAAPAIKTILQDMSLKFHLEQHSKHTFTLFPVREIRPNISTTSSGLAVSIENPYAAQPMQLTIRALAPVNGLHISLPGTEVVAFEGTLDKGQLIIVQAGKVYIADANRKLIADITKGNSEPILRVGTTTVSLSIKQDAPVDKSAFAVTTWAVGPGIQLGK